MAESHNGQSSPRLQAAKGALQKLRTEFSPPKTASLLALLGLGLLAWLAQVGWLYGSGTAPPLPLALSAGPVGLLVLGIATLAVAPRDHARTAARVLLLCLYPAALVSVVATVPQASIEAVHTPLSMLLCGVALLAYCTGAAVSCATPAPPPGNSVAVGRNGEHHTRSAPEVVRILFAIAWTAAALVLVTAAPLWPPFEEVERVWGQGAAAGAVLSAVVASALAVASVAIFLGSVLRASDAEPPLRAAEMRMRVVTLVFVALVSGVLYITLA